MEIATSFRSYSIPHPATLVCPDCRGKGYTVIEVRESVTVGAPNYPVTYPVVCYRTRPCWRCHGRGLVREEER